MTLQVVSLSPSLLKRVQYIAESTGVQADAFVEDAIKSKVENWHQKLIEQEALAYNRLHPTLIENFLGQFVGVIRGQVVDHDKSLDQLKMRLNVKFGDLPLFITQVKKNPLPVFNAPRPRLNQRSK